MPEGVDMNIEQGRNISPESSGEKPISQWSFRQVQREKNLLDKRLQDPLANEKQKNEAKGRMGEVRGRLQELLGDMHEIGAFDGVRSRYETLELMRQRGELDAKTLLEEQRFASRVDDEIGIEKEDPHYGIVRWYYEVRLGLLRSSLGTSLETPWASKSVPGEEVVSALGRVEQAVRIQTEREEPGIERIKIPETAEECIKIVEDRLFVLLDKAITEKKGTRNYSNEYRTIESFIRRIPEDDDRYKGEKENDLSRHLSSRFPEGVFLKEKLTLLLEAFQNLTNRTVEVDDAEGSLLKLGAEKAEVALAKELQISFTNITPVDWYVLCHIHTLFPESVSVPETRIDIQKAWDIWSSIGDKPYKRGEKDWELETILGSDNNLIDKADRKITEDGITLEHIYRSEAVEQLVRNAIIQKFGQGNRTIQGVRSELLAWCFLKVGLTFDMWDRKRWKIKGDNGARDLMWFPYKQISRMAAERSGGGVLDTAGSYWAYEGQSEVALKFRDMFGERAEEIYRILKRNEEERKVILIAGDWKSEGTIVGDFWSSTSFRDGKKTIFFRDRDSGKVKHSEVANKVKLKEKRLEEIPWLDPWSQIEDGTYSGYFGYSLGLAKAAVDSLMKTGGQGWGPENFATQSFWRAERDLLVRLPDYCPFMLIKEDSPTTDRNGNLIDKGNDERIQLIARTFARGIFWLGSYKAQPPKDFLGIIPLPRKGLYTYDQAKEILRAIEGSGFLTEEHYNGLLGDIKEYNFFKKGASSPQRR